MKHFIVAQTTRAKRGTTYTETTLWIIKRNVPVKLGTRVSTFESAGQAVMNCAAAKGATAILPKEAFVESPLGGYKHTPWSLKEAGIATFHEL